MSEQLRLRRLRVQLRLGDLSVELHLQHLLAAS
jgi:hypothetical protein